MIKTVLFDFDGTLADTAPDLVAALNDWLRARRRPPVDLAEARLLCSGGARALLTLASWGDEDFAAARDDYLRRYENTGYRRTALFAGVAAMLRALRQDGFSWGVVTNKPRRYFAAIAARLDLAGMGARALIAGDDLPRRKPHPDLLLLAAEKCGVLPEQCLYVGDDIRDAQAAAAAGMAGAQVTWGYWQEAQWQTPNPPAVDFWLTAPATLPPAVRALCCIAK